MMLVAVEALSHEEVEGDKREVLTDFGMLKN